MAQTGNFSLNTPMPIMMTLNSVLSLKSLERSSLYLLSIIPNNSHYILPTIAFKQLLLTSTTKDKSWVVDCQLSQAVRLVSGFYVPILLAQFAVSAIAFFQSFINVDYSSSRYTISSKPSSLFSSSAILSTFFSSNVNDRFF